MLKTKEYIFSQEELDVPAGVQELLSFKSGKAGGKTVVYIHGFNRFGGWQEFWNADHILEKGHSAVLPSQLGFGKSQGERDYCGPNTCESIASALEDFCKRENISSDDLIIWGHSRGALVTATLAVTHPNLAGAYVCQSGAYDFERNYNNPTKPEKIRANMSEETGGASEEEMAKRSPILNVQNIAKPVLIIHGDLDETVSVEQARLFAEALDKAGKKYELHILEGQDHYTGKASRPIVFDFIERIFRA